ncbi:hypothetical protein BY996DRAFT_6410877 [Phakopsora pachyrhizi]|nr:hypothetical protein BY996DRAFT_6410877 [Phakopsora pachyrhizi]
MLRAGNFILASLVILLALFRGIIKPKIDEIGLFRKAINLNNKRCYRVEALEACEDLFVDRDSGLAYLACSNRLHRAYWTPALTLLRRDKLPFPSQDYIAVLNLNTLKHHKLDLVNLPPHLIKNGLHTHGIDLYVHPSDGFEDDHGQIRLSGDSSDGSGSVRKATIYAINHNPPDDLNTTSSVGAQSVIEVFDTLLGDTQATHRRTIESGFILTPNNIVGMSESSFYVSNDHKKKVHWFNADSELPRATDNIHLTPSGAIITANIPAIAKFIGMVKKYPTDKELSSPVEVWRVSNSSFGKEFVGGKVQVEKVYYEIIKFLSLV